MLPPQRIDGELISVLGGDTGSLGGADDEERPFIPAERIRGCEGGITVPPSCLHHEVARAVDGRVLARVNDGGTLGPLYERRPVESRRRGQIGAAVD